MAAKGSMIGEGSGGAVTDRKRNSELFKELENNGFLKSEQVGKEKLYLNFRLLEVLRA
jgi:hypothetical protein